jgi:RNA polymerase sigma factor (sigma-70 family)
VSKEIACPIIVRNGFEMSVFSDIEKSSTSSKNFKLGRRAETLDSGSEYDSQTDGLGMNAEEVFFNPEAIVETFGSDDREELLDASFDTYLSKIRGGTRISIEREREFFSLLEDDILLVREKARREIIESHLWLVPVIVRRFVGRGSAFEDLVAEGNLGLFDALTRFDVNRGLRFSSYAKWWIMHFVTTAMAASGYSVKLPKRVALAMSKRREQEFRPKGNSLGEGFSADFAHSSTTSGASTEQQTQALVQSLLDWTAPAISVEETAEMPAASELQPEVLFALREQLTQLSEAVQTLPAREREIITARYGLNGAEPLTLHEVARALNLSAERVRTLQLSATEKLRKKMGGAFVGNDL